MFGKKKNKYDRFLLVSKYRIDLSLDKSNYRTVDYDLLLDIAKEEHKKMLALYSENVRKRFYDYGVMVKEVKLLF